MADSMESGGCVDEGDFQNGERTGKGMLRFPDGTRYEAEFLKGKFSGSGTLYYPDGKIFMQGKWANDQFSKGWVDGIE